MNTWPDGHRHAMDQGDHESWNAKNYPGTRQMCGICDEPTGHCEDDSTFDAEGRPLCDDCRKECPQCGEATGILKEGYCVSCCDANQAALDLHNQQNRQWNSMTDSQRESAIRDATKLS